MTVIYVQRMLETVFHSLYIQNAYNRMSWRYLADSVGTVVVGNIVVVDLEVVILIPRTVEALAAYNTMAASSDVVES